MNPNIVFYPMFTLAFFTGLIGLRLFLVRMHAMRTQRVRPQDLQDGNKWDEVFKDAENPSDALINLFEVPILFYVLVLAVFVTNHSDFLYVAGFWIFVLARISQGVIHCTSNRIKFRALSYGVGCAVVFSLWIRFAIQILGY